MPISLDIFPLRVGGKEPLHSGWQTRRYSEEELKQLAESGHNLGVRIGPRQLVIDLDPKNDFLGRSADELLAEVSEFLGADLSAAPRVETSSGGAHVYLDLSADVAGTREQHPEWGSAIQFLRHGKYVVAPGSVHPDTGKRYEWREPPERAIPAPAALLKALERAAAEASGQQDHSPEWVRQCLATLDARAYQIRDEWLRVLFACHAANPSDEGWAVFQEWSARDPRYAGCEEENRKDWLSASANRPGGVTSAHLVAEVTRNGHVVPPDYAQAATDFQDEPPPAPEPGAEDSETEGTSGDTLSAGVLPEMRTLPGGSFLLASGQSPPPVPIARAFRDSRFPGLYYDTYWLRMPNQSIVPRATLRAELYEFLTDRVLRVDKDNAKLRRRYSPKVNEVTAIEDALGALLIKERSQRAAAEPLKRRRMSGPRPPRTQSKWVVPGLLPRGEMVLLAAEPGAGKSALAVGLLTALENGRPFGPLRAATPPRCFFVLTEDAHETNRDRIQAAAQAQGLDPGKMVWPDERVLSRDDFGREGPTLFTMQAPLFRNFEGGESRVAPTMLFESLRQRVIQESRTGGLDVLVIDPLSRVLGPTVPENDNGAASAVVGMLQELAEEAKVALLLVHHPPKGKDGSPSSAEMVRGAGAWRSASRGVLMLTAKKTATGQEPRWVLGTDKVNHGPSNPNIMELRRVIVDLGGESCVAVVPAASEAAEDDFDDAKADVRRADEVRALYQLSERPQLLRKTARGEEKPFYRTTASKEYGAVEMLKAQAPSPVDPPHVLLGRLESAGKLKREPNRDGSRRSIEVYRVPDEVAARLRPQWEDMGLLPSLGDLGDFDQRDDPEDVVQNQ